MAAEQVSYDKNELRAVIRAFKVMDDESIQAAKTQSGALATYLQRKIIDAAGQTRNAVDDRIAQGSRVSKSSKIGEISFGFASQRFRRRYNSTALGRLRIRLKQIQAIPGVVRP